MSLFRRENTPEAPTVGPSAPEAPAGAASKRRLTHVAPGTKVKGEISGATELLVDGEVEGEVRVQASVTIGADGTVSGPITAPSVRVAGRVVGDVAAHDRVEVTASGSLEGNISAPRIVIGEGAFFRGKVEMKGMEAKPEPALAGKPSGEKPQGKLDAVKNKAG